MTILAVAWDIDGTLIDSEPLHHRSLVAGTLHFGIDLSDIPEDEFRGVHMHDVWASIRSRLPAGIEQEQWFTAIHAHYVANSRDLRPISGAIEASAAIASHGLTQVCVSNSDRRIVDTNIAALGIADRLAFSLSINDVKCGKPDPESYRAAAHKLGIAPERMVAVEDSVTGARAARDAGMIVVGYQAQRIAFADLDYLIADYRELDAMLHRHLGLERAENYNARPE